MTRRPRELIARLIGIGALLLALTATIWPSAKKRAAANSPLSTAALDDSSGISIVRELSARIAASAPDSAWPTVAQQFTHLPTSRLRAILSAPIAAGMPFAWSDSTHVAGLAVMSSADVDPQDATTVRAVGANAALLIVGDGAGVLDSIAATASTANGGSSASGIHQLTVRAARMSGAPIATQHGSRATSAAPTRAILRRVRVFARPGWEAKFATAALEERGWHVDGSVLIARRASVTVGAPVAIDTANYSAVIVLDSGLISATVLQRYLAQGGGVVLADDAMSDAALRVIAPATVSGMRTAVPGALLTSTPRLGVDAWLLKPVSRAVVLERDASAINSEPTVVVWRQGAGRVAASALRESWRWRMEGNDDGMTSHRSYWSSLVSAVAFTPRPRADSAENRVNTEYYPGDGAPYADAVARFGPPGTTQSLRADRAAQRGPFPLWVLYIVGSAALLAEWWMRRRRGAR